MLHEIVHAVEHTFEESIVLIPILFITYILMEWLEHKAKDKSLNMIRFSGKLGPVAGGLFGIIPQCGFSGAAASFYTAHSITLGTLIAVFMATSDEMIPILISAAIEPIMIGKILLVKCVAGVICGYLVDILYKKRPKIEANHIHDFCEQEHCECDKGIVASAVKHTISIFAFIFVVSILAHLLVHYAEEQHIILANSIWNHPILGHFLTGLVGLIPNCAASVLITELYVNGIIDIGIMMTGLFVNAGIGLLVLFKVNHHLKENLTILGILYVLGVVAGMVSGFIL